MKGTLHSLVTLCALTLGITLYGVNPPSSLADDPPQKEAAKKAEELSIVAITPTGEDVPASRKLVIQFSRPVVPLGRMDRRPDELPIAITPELPCEWRWIDRTNLACMLGSDEAMKKATKYTIVVSPGITAEDGGTIAEPFSHEFITSRPRISSNWFSKWLAPGHPAVRINFDQQVMSDTVAAHLFYEVEGKRIGVTAKLPPDDQTEGESETIVNPTKDLPIVAEVTVPGKSYGGRAWIIEPKEELPLGAEVVLNVEPGIKGTLGPELSTEEREVIQFRTFPEFKFLGVRCRDNETDELFFSVDEPLVTGAEAGEGCNPLSTVYLVFSSPVIKEEVKPALRTEPDLAGGRTDFDPWENVYSWSRLESPPRDETSDYELPLPYGLKAFQLYSIRADKGSIKDEFGRALPAPMDFKFRTNHREPRFVLDTELSVLERDVDSHLPVFVTNLKDVNVSYDVLTTTGLKENQSLTIPVAQAEDISFAIPLKIREMIGASTGVMTGTIKTTPPTEPPGGFKFHTQVSPFHVHTKIGHYDTLVWVTDFTSGLPVSGATVEILSDLMYSLSPSSSPLTKAVTGPDGVAILEGTRTIDPDLTRINAWEMSDPRLHVQVTKGTDIARLPLVNSYEVQPRGANDTWISSYMKKRYGHVKAWGTTAQGVYKLNDTVQYKLYVRDTDGTRLVPAESDGYSLEVIDPMDKVVHEVKSLSLNEFGAFNGEFQTPATGAMGWYRVVLSKTGTEYKWEPLRVLITDFTPAPFRVTAQIKGEIFGEQQDVPFSVEARLHSGGPYAHGQLRVTGQISEAEIPRNDPKLAGFSFDTAPIYGPIAVHSSESQVDEQGNFTGTFTLEKPAVYYGTLSVEAAVKDERGKYVAGQGTAKYFSRDRFVGLKSGDWLLDTGKEATIDVAVVDERGNLAAGSAVKVAIQRSEVRATRVKGAGNAYLTNYETVQVDVPGCELTSIAGISHCAFTPDKPGDYKIVATVTDTKGRTHSTDLTKWVRGPGAMLWNREDGNTMQVLPEKTEYKVGETARFMVQNPFPTARALITVERYGVMKRWTKDFTQPIEVIELPIEADHIPGVFFSVVAMSSRVDKPVDENQVDLGKPLFAMGYAQLEVRDPAKELIVEVKADREVYKPREKVKLTLSTRTRDSGSPEKLHPKTEMAIAVLDEAVFDLITGGNNYFDPYKGLNALDSLDLSNYNVLRQLVGRRKFEVKGGTPGGGGGFDSEPRSLFKFVAYWNPSVIPDGNGNASVEFDLPDNLTGWRVLAMAVTPGDRMGLGVGGLKVNQPTEIRAALPNQVIEGDRFNARFTVMNRTNAPRTIEVHGEVAGAPVKSFTPLDQKVEVAPYERKEVSFPVETKIEGELTFTVRAGDASDHDALRVPMPVKKRMALEAVADWGSLEGGGTATQSIKYPADIRTDVGSLDVLLSSTVVAGLEGAFEYLRDYPYLCWEQQLTKGAMAAQYQNLRRYLKKDFVWLGNENLPKAMLALAGSFQAPNGGMTFFIPADQYVSPYLSAYTAIAFNWMRRLGHEPPAAVEERLQNYLLGLLGETPLPDFYSKGMASTTRAVALAALAERGKVGREEVIRHMPHLKEMDLFGAAHLLQALTRIQDTEYAQQAVIDWIRSHADQSSGKLVFSEEIDFAYERILSSRLRTNCAILSALIGYEDAHPKGTPVSDVPFKLVRSITQTRKNSGRWENTQENMFCMAAVSAYAAKYEKADPDFSVEVAVNGEQLGTEQFKGVKETPVVFSRPIREGDDGKAASVTIKQEGTGRLYHSTRLTFSPKVPRESSTNAGIEIRREYSVERGGKFELLKKPYTVKVGELVRVDLYLSIPAQRNFVVVADPIPGGLEPVNRDLATASQVDADKANIRDEKGRLESQYAGGSIWFDYRDWHEYGVDLWSFYHRELRHDSARYYSEYLPAGNYHLTYVAQAIAPGTFTTLPTHAEEMYDPDVFGQSGAFELVVEPAQ